MFSAPCFALDDEKRYVGMSFSVVVAKKPETDLRFILALLNSAWACKWFFANGKHRGIGVDIGVEKLRTFPVPRASDREIGQITERVDRIIKTKKIDPNADTTCLEREIDQFVNTLYESPPTKSKLIEGESNRETE